MSRHLPLARPDPQARDAQSTLAALESACRDAALDPAGRLLLQQAIAALRAAAAESSTERQRYRALFDAMPDPVSIIAWDGTVLDLNKAGMAAYRRRREEIVGQPIHALNPDLPRDHLGPVLDALNRGETYVVEVTNMRADGSRFPVEVHSARMEYDGKPAIVAVARDLSARHDAEVRYGELLEAIDKGILLASVDGRILHSNPAAMRILGIEDERDLRGALDPSHWLVVDEGGNVLPAEEWPVARAARTGQTVESTVVGLYHRHDRRLTWLSVTAVPRFEPGATRPHQVLLLFSDVTALKRDSALFDRVQALAHIGGWQWDGGRDRLYLTEEACRILGLATPPSRLQDLQKTLRNGDRQRLDDALRRVLRDGGGFDLEVQGHRADGHSFWARMIGEAEPSDPTGNRLACTLQDITERKHSEETLRVQARTDPLTGLLNRDAVLNEITARLDDPGQSSIAVLYIDLDRFKVVNDVLGHAAGDALLVEAALRIGRAIGTEGLLARFGGDEFLVVCSVGDDPTRPTRLADAVLRRFEAGFVVGDDEFAITASIGIACAPLDGTRSQQLIQNADFAMYDSKRRMRNGWQAYSDEMSQRQLDRLQLETHLRRAIENQEFHLVYQPQVDLHKLRTVGVEALIRWHNEELGAMRPDLFITHAETTGDIVRIGDWVLREACRQLAGWREQGLPIERIAVNVSYRQFIGDDLTDSVAAALAESGLPGSALELEFTERVLIEDAPDTVRVFGQLRALGVVLTIDDFGEGYSALNYLRRLPIHGLKLSQLFVGGVPGNQSDVAVCQAVAGIAQSLGLELVAEGVESEAQRQFLLRLGVRTGQGFLFSPGLTADEFASSLLAEDDGGKDE